MEPDDRDDPTLPPDDLDLSASPHDAFIKWLFLQREYATRFFRRHLPASIVSAAEWNSLEILPASFVKSQLGQLHSDLLFSLHLGEGRCLLYLLFEHQSTVDPSMPLRILGYLSEILQRHHHDHGLPLPPVIPFVFHQGPDRWSVPLSFEDIFELPETAAEDLLTFLPRFRHALLDLSTFDPDSEEDDLVLRVVLQLMKLARTREMLRYFRWLAALTVDHLPESLLKRVLLYALHADQDLDVEEIYRHLSSNPELQREAMSVAEKLKAEGRQEGLQKGLQEGLQKGRLEALVDQIQFLEELLGERVSSRKSLEALPADELESRCQELRRRCKGGAAADEG